MIKFFGTLFGVLMLTLILFTDNMALPRRGFMLETYGLDVAKTQRDVNALADRKATLVRFPIYFSRTNDIQFWKNFADAVYTTANQRRVNLVIDFHHPGAAPDSTITDENDFVAKWAIFAQHFGSKTNRVISIWYDLCNEPNHPNWAGVALRAAQEIRRYDGHTAIIYAAKGTTTLPASSSSFRPLPGIGNQIVEFHFWDWYSTVQSPSPNANNYRYVGNAGSSSSTNYTLAQLQAKLENVRRFGANYGVPVYIGEVGINQSHRDAARFLRDFTAECDNKGIHLTVHAYNEAPVWNYELNPNAWQILTSWLAKR